jgi:hypothetical protein
LEISKNFSKWSQNPNIRKASLVRACKDSWRWWSVNGKLLKSPSVNGHFERVSKHFVIAFPLWHFYGRLRDERWIFIAMGWGHKKI